MKKSYISFTFDLDVVRRAGFTIDIQSNGNFEAGKMLLSSETIGGAVLQDDVAADLEQRIGINKTNKLQAKVAASIQRAVLLDALKNAME